MVVRSLALLLLVTVRVALYAVAVAVIGVALWLLFFASGLAQWVPAGIAFGGLLLLMGALLVGAADRAHLD